MTYLIMNHNVDIHNKEELQKYIDSFDYDIHVLHGEKHYYLEGEDITQKIREREVTLKPQNFSLRRRGSAGTTPL